MQDLINQIIELIQGKDIGTREKSEWIERLPTLTEEQLQDLLKVLQAKSKEELEDLQQNNLTKLENQVQELEKITNQGVKLIYQKGEEVSREKEKTERDSVIAELQKL